MKLTEEELKALIVGVVEDILTTKGPTKFSDLKDEVHAEFDHLVGDKLQPQIDGIFEKLRALPSPDGKAGDGNGDLKGLNPTGGYSCFAEFAKDVYLADLKGAETSPKFDKWMGDIRAYRKVLEEAKTAGTPTLELQDPEQGGYLAPEEFSKNILSLVYQNSNFMNRCTKIPMAINQIGIPYQQGFNHTSYLHGAMMAYWLEELAAKTPSKPKWGKITLKLNKLALLVFASDELLEDSIISMEPLLKEKATDVIGWKIDEAVVRGSGAGQPLGIIAAGNPSKIAQGAEAGQAAATIKYENIIKMWSRMYPSSLNKAIWVANSIIFPQLATMSLAVGTGGSAVYIPPNGAAGAPYGTLLGKPIVFTEHCSTLGTEGDLIFADFSQYLIGQKRGRGAGIQYASSIHLKFDYDQTAFRFVMRLDGQPWWPSVYTPKRGQTQSPFITLATRP